MKRVVCVSLVLALLSGCRVTRTQRAVGVYGTGAVGVVAAAISLHAMFVAACAPEPGVGSSDCEDARIERRNVAGLIGLGALLAAIVAQAALEVEERPPPATVRVVEAPPPPPAHAAALHGGESVALARRAQTFAAEGKCVEALGALNALRRIDRPLADQLAAWDPVVSRCRKQASPTSIEATVEAGPPGASVPPVEPPPN